MSQSFSNIQLPVSTMDVGRGVAIPPQPTVDRVLELAAMLEAVGVNDALARSYGVSDVFVLAEALAARPSVVRGLGKQQRPSPKAGREEPLLLTLLRSPLILAVMGVMMVAAHFYSVALGDMGAPDWTTLLGLVVGTVISAGVFQSSSWRVSLAIGQGAGQGVGSILLMAFAFGAGLAAFAAVGLEITGLALGAPPAGLVALGVSCLGMTLLLMLSGSLVLLNRFLLAAGAVGLAFDAAWLFWRFWPTGGGPVWAIAFGYVLACALMLGAVALTLRELSKEGQERAVHHLPVEGQLFYKALPYLCYGALPVIYVLTSQVGGWLGRLLPGWTAPQAVAALNIAHFLGLGTLILSQGIAEFQLRAFWRVVADVQRQAGTGDLTAVVGPVRAFLSRSVGLLLSGQLLIAGASLMVVVLAWERFGLAALFGRMSPFMVLASLIGYSLLAIGLFQCSFLVTLGRPWQATRVLSLAMAVACASCLALGVVGNFDLSVLGTIIGGACLVLLGRRELRGLLERLDYILYQAF